MCAQIQEMLHIEQGGDDQLKDELNNIKDKYGDKRRSEIEHSAEEFTVEDMIPDEDMVITVSHQGYLKRTSLDEYRTQGRGGLGARGVKTKDDDFNEHLFIASTHNYLQNMVKYFGKKYGKYQKVLKFQKEEQYKT